MKNRIQPDKMYSLQEVMEILRVSERSMHRYIHGGKLKATKIGYWRIAGSDLLTFLTENSNIREGLTKREMYIPVKSSETKPAKKQKKKI